MTQMGLNMAGLGLCSCSGSRVQQHGGWLIRFIEAEVADCCVCSVEFLNAEAQLLRKRHLRI